MSDQYLWDGSGPEDPEIAALEATLRPLRHRPTPLPSRRPASAFAKTPADRRSFSGGWLAGLQEYERLTALALAASLALAVGATWWIASSRGVHDALLVTSIVGTPTIGQQSVGEGDPLSRGRVLTTDARSMAGLAIGTLGQISLEPSSELRFLGSQAGRYRLRLERGTVQATITAPPGQFLIETPSSAALDLGCVYSLTVDEQGNGLVRVTSGWVGFAARGQESLIPAGAVCATRRGVGPGTPHFADAAPALRDALERMDFARLDAAAMSASIDTVLAEARPQDAFTLWHLVRRAPPAERGRLFDRLSVLSPPPDGITRDGIIRLDRTMLDRWWDDFGFGAMELWRQWRQEWQDAFER